ncbi:hypothetical protein E2C01_056983 [Portunus trituberculatus]|uniref:Uncharacterized protein n=1 Tax=Portunus trituberculatus TaxID=210409 RepID=A0A5B7GYU5_PORTR|nr:hypothetical protein [Portunus trituberculatus]
MPPCQTLSLLLCIQHTEMGLRHGYSNHSRENQHNTYSGPPTGKGKTPEGTSALGNPGKGLEK